MVDYGVYAMISMLMLAGVFFVMALANRDKPKSLKYTAYGYITLAILGLVILGFVKSEDLKISVLILLALSAIYHFFYGRNAGKY
jgi:predicted membrane channel-forming protein YqfA (hemolysin III family)